MDEWPARRSTKSYRPAGMTGNFLADFLTAYFGLMMLIIGIAFIALFCSLFNAGRRQLKTLPPYEAEVTKASHGAAIIFLAWWLGPRLDFWHLLLPREDWQYVTLAACAAAAFGIYWFVLGAARSSSYFRDAHIMTKSMVKIGVGLAAFHFTPAIARWVGYPALTTQIVLVFGFWCVITGAVKLGLAMRRAPVLDDFPRQPDAARRIEIRHMGAISLNGQHMGNRGRHSFGL